MKSPATKKISLRGTPPPQIGTPPIHYDDVPGKEYAVGSTFFALMMKAAGLTQKEVMYHFRVNKTTAHGWYNGTKRDPFIGSKMGCDLMRKSKRGDLIAPVLGFVAGVDFDSAVLQRVTELLQKGTVE